MTSLCSRNHGIGHKMLSLQKTTFGASNFIGKCNISRQKPQAGITAASVTKRTKPLQVTGKESKEIRWSGTGKKTHASRWKERSPEEQLQSCGHKRSPVDVGNTRRIHNAIVHHHQDKKMNGIPWRQQSEYLGDFFVTFRGWKFRAREYFLTWMT